MKGYFKRLTYESKFSRKFACWCQNHSGISKLKKSNRREARAKLKRELKNEKQEL